MPIKKLFSEALDWSWPLNIADDQCVLLILKKQYGINENLTDREQILFFKKLRSSLSLGFDEKKRVFANYSNLSKNQLDAIEEVFDREIKNFKEFQKEHHDDILKLCVKNELEWSLLLNPNYGIFNFFQYYIFSSRIKDEYISNNVVYNQINRTLHHLELYFELDYINRYLLSSGTLPTTFTVDCINNVIYSLIETEQCKTIESIEKNNLFKRVTKVKHRNNHFIQLLPTSYLAQRYGLSGFVLEDKNKFLYYYRKAKGPPDMASFIGFCYLCLGDQKSALNAFKWSIRKYNKRNSLNLDLFAEKFTESSLSQQGFDFDNGLRNLLRYSLLLRDVGKGQKQHLKSFKNLVRSMKKWTPSNIERFFPEYIYFNVIYGGKYNKDKIINSDHINNYIKYLAPDHNKCLFNILVSDSVFGYDFIGLKNSLSKFKSKISILFYWLLIRELILFESNNESDKALIDIHLMRVYFEALRENNIKVDKELSWIKSY